MSRNYHLLIMLSEDEHITLLRVKKIMGIKTTSALIRFFILYGETIADWIKNQEKKKCINTRRQNVIN